MNFKSNKTKARLKYAACKVNTVERSSNKIDTRCCKYVLGVHSKACNFAVFSPRFLYQLPL